MGLFKSKPKRPPTPLAPPKLELANLEPEPEPPAVADTHPELLWLADAPLFIDETQVNAFYDAVLRPDYELTTVALGNSISAQTTLGGQMTLGAALPFMGKAQLEASAEYARTAGRSTDTTLTPISNSYRHLLAMALYYAGSVPERLIIANGETITFEPNRPDWLAGEFILGAPRPLVFLDVPPGTEFMPAALETTGEDVNVLANTVAEKLKAKDRSLKPPPYPGSSATADEKRGYFSWFRAHYDDEIALLTVEKAAGKGDIEWIDFNIPLGLKGDEFLHLHFVPRTKYTTDVFAYNLIRRGFNHGLRIVGTLKTGPDLNVLAIFEH